MKIVFTGDVLYQLVEDAFITILRKTEAAFELKKKNNSEWLANTWML